MHTICLSIKTVLKTKVCGCVGCVYVVVVVVVSFNKSSGIRLDI